MEKRRPVFTFLKTRIYEIYIPHKHEHVDVPVRYAAFFQFLCRHNVHVEQVVKVYHVDRGQPGVVFKSFCRGGCRLNKGTTWFPWEHGEETVQNAEPWQMFNWKNPWF